MKISEVMSLEPEVVAPDAKLHEVAEMMRNYDVGMLPVCDGDRLRGMVTDRDIVVRGVVNGQNIEDLTASDVMTPEVVYCFEDQSLEEAAELMEEKQIRRLVILNNDKRLTGVVSLGDIAAKTGNSEKAGSTLEKVSQPGGSVR